MNLNKCKNTSTSIKSLLKNYPTPIYNCLLGSAMISKDVVVLENHHIIMRRDHQTMRGKVKIIAGGGSGTEPAEAYYVGKGMLTAAVMGEVFSAPSANEILIAIRELAEENCDGILLLVKNYIGDKLNFTLALEKALAENITVKMLIIGEGFNHLNNERQGLAGCVLMYKIIGEMAEQGKTIEEIIEECTEKVLPDLVSVSVAMSPSSHVISHPLLKCMKPDEMVLGIGIYGKGGAKKFHITDLKSAICRISDEIFTYFQSKSTMGSYKAVVLVNNLGGINKLEEAIIANEVTNGLNELGLKIIQLYVGTFMSSLDMQGFSVSVLKIDSLQIIKYLTAPTTVLSWPKNTIDLSSDKPISVDLVTITPKWPHDELNKTNFDKIPFGPRLSDKAVAALKQITIFASEALISCERQLNIIDAEIGDGDAGSILKKAADELKKAVIEDTIDIEYPGKFLHKLSEICCEQMGGISGAIYNILFKSAAQVFQYATEITPELCCSSFKTAVKGVQLYGTSELGDRTILDVLCPAADSFESAIMSGKGLSQAVYMAATTCESKAEETKSLKPTFLQGMGINQPMLYADAGAHAATIWLRAISEGLRLHYPKE